jgi:hypothetical protein
VFIRSEILDAKTINPNFVYVNPHIIKYKYIIVCRPTTKKELWGTKIH